MSPTEINRAIHEAVGANQYVGLMKRGYWWRPNGNGYTDRQSKAGRYTREEAGRIAPVSDNEVTIHEFAPLDYCGDLNEIQKAIESRTPNEVTRILLAICDMCAVEHVWPILAPASMRARAFVQALKLSES